MVMDSLIVAFEAAVLLSIVTFFFSLGAKPQPWEVELACFALLERFKFFRVDACSVHGKNLLKLLDAY
jgi:hypothetical protein